MSCQLYELCQTIGDTVKRSLTILDGDGNPEDITGSTVYMTLKRKKTDADVDALFQKVVTSHTDPLNGQTEIIILPSDTKTIPEGTYWYDIQITTSLSEIYTLYKGNYKLTFEITDA